jgi:hypothetical protein
MQDLWPNADGMVPFVRGADGSCFTSAYYWTNYLFPWLYHLKQEGDPTLIAFTQEDGNWIKNKYYSINSYGEGAAPTVRNVGWGRK